MEVGNGHQITMYTGIYVRTGKEFAVNYLLSRAYAPGFVCGLLTTYSNAAYGVAIVMQFTIAELLHSSSTKMKQTITVTSDLTPDQ